MSVYGGTLIMASGSDYDALQRLEEKYVGTSNYEVKQHYVYETDSAGNTGNLVEEYSVAYSQNGVPYLLVYKYEYDGNGNIISITETQKKAVDDEDGSGTTPTVPGTMKPQSEGEETISPYLIPGEDSVIGTTIVYETVSEYTYAYTYDEVGQLTYAKDEKAGKAYRYGYNASGNMVISYVYNIAPDGTEVLSYRTNYSYTNGVLSSVKKLGTSVSTTSTYQVDRMGNPTEYTSGGKTYYLNWGEGRMLTSIGTDENNITSYTYNADGLRASKTVTVNGESRTTEYIWGNNGLVGTVSGDTTVIVLYDVDGEPAGFSVNGTVYTYVKNIQGDVMQILDSNGNAVVSYTYDPWGVPTVTGNTSLAIINPCSYRGYDYDEETGYYYLQSRYYDPSNNRFLTGDDPSTLIKPDNITGNNVFLYCFNCAINYKDDNGFWAQNYSGFYRTSHGFSVNYSSKFLSKTFCVSFAADVIRLYGGWSLSYGYSYKKMGTTRIAKELYAHAILYCIGKGLLASSLCNTVLNAIIRRFASSSVLKTLTSISQKINYIQYKIGYYLFDHSRVIDVNNNEKWYRIVVFNLIWAVL